MSTIKRIVTAGFTAFWRNTFVSFTSVMVMTVTLFVIGSLIFNNVLLDAALTELREKVDINVYFVPSASEEEVIAFQRELEQNPEVAEIEYVSREQALAEFRERHAGDELTLQALDELGDNPLGAVLNIRAQETSQYASIAESIEERQRAESPEDPFIDKVNYAQNRTAIERLQSIIDTSEKSNLVQTLFLVIVAFLVTFSTIRFAIYTSRDEIAVMRLVGASNMYIRGPFVFEGALYGLIGAILAIIIFYPIVYWFGPLFYPFPIFGDAVSGNTLYEYYISNFAKLFGIILASGVLLGALSSYVAVRKYLKV